MSAHRRWRRARLGSTRIRAALGLGVVACVGVTGTFASWTDDATIGGTTFTSGVLDLKVDDVDAYATSTLGMAAMVPGNTSAEVLVVRNGGTAPLKYTLTGGLIGTDAAAYAAAGSLKLTVVLGGSRSGSGTSATCTGGTTVYGPTALTALTTTPIIGTRRGPLAPATGSESLCFQVTFDAAAPSSLQGRTASATFTATGTSDLS
jgi:predicted ribosomally synthesized peptide with SipW-like signal peptide